MTALTANLKHLYQRRGMWLVYMFLVPFVCVYIVTWYSGGLDEDEDIIEIGFTLVPVLGMVFTALLTSVLNKPMSFCLPAHLQQVRLLWLGIGIVLSTFMAGLFMTAPAGMIVTGFFTSLLLYWLGVALALRYPKASQFIGLWPLFMLWVQEASVLLWIERYAGIWIALGAADTVFMWHWLGRREHHRRLCGAPYVSLFDAYNINRVQRIRQQQAGRKYPGPQKWETRLEPWLLHSISTDRPFSGLLIGRAIYILLGPLLMYWKQAVVIWVLFAVWFCYWGPMGFVVPFCIAFALGQVDLRVYARSVRLLDRRQLFMSSLGGAAVLSASALIIVGALTAITHGITPWMPAFQVFGKSFHFVSLSWPGLMLPVLLIPLSLIVQLFFYRSRRLVLPLVLGAAFGGLFGFVQAVHVNPSWNPGWLSLMAMSLLLWIAFAYALRRVCFKYDLIKP